MTVKLGKFHIIEVINDKISEFHVCDTESLPSVEKQVMDAMAQGATVKWHSEDGREQFYQWNYVINSSTLYDLYKSGNKVKAEKFLCTRFPDGTLEREHVGYVYMKP